MGELSFLAAGGETGALARIVLAEDNADMRAHVAGLLAALYRVETVADGEEALAAIRRERPDLVISDIMLPRLDGLALLKELRADETLRDTAVILLSAQAGEEARIEGIERGAADCLVEPFSARELLARVGAVLELRRMRRKVEQAFHEREEQLRLATEAAEVGFWDVDTVNEKLVWPPRVKAMFGISPDAPISMADFYAGLHPDDRERTSAAFAAALDQTRRALYDVEYRTVGKEDGLIRWVAAKGRGIFDDSGTCVRVIGTAIDISARRRTERQLRESEERLHNLVRQSAVGIAECDIEGRFRFVNDRYCEMLGYPREKLLSLRVQDITHPDDVARNLDLYRRCVGQGESFEIEKRYVRSDGTLLWVRNRVSPVRGGNEAITGVGAISEDVTERKLAEENLREEIRVRELLANVGQALVGAQLDLQKVVQIATDAAREISGAAFGAFFYNVTSPEGESFRLYTLSGAPPEAFARLPQPRNTAIFGPTFPGEAAVRSADITADPRYGQNPPFRGMPEGHLPVRSHLAVPVKAASGEVLGGLFFGHPHPGVFDERAERLVLAVAAQAAVAFDNARLHQAAQHEIARRKEMESHLASLARERESLLQAERSARADVEAANRLKDEFLATVSHELRTPLSTVISWGRVLQKLYRGDDRQIERGLSVIIDNARLQAQIISDLLDMSRIVAGKIQLELTPSDLGQLIESAVEGQRPAAEAKRIGLTIKASQEALVADIDVTRLQQVFWNLLSNAIKFTPEGGQVSIEATQNEGWAEIVVRDTGVGISASFLPHVFDRFRQADSRVGRRFGGLGLGLAIVKQLVELHGGTVEARSAGEGSGAAFTVRVPLQRSDGRLLPAGDISGSSEPSGQVLEGLRILAVEDDAEMSEVLSRILEEYGASVTAVRTGISALEALRSGKRFHLLLSDIGMPEMDGFELLRAVRAQHSAAALPAIAVTAFSRDEDRQLAMKAGFQDFVTKPYEVGKLVGLARKLGAGGPKSSSD